jgi:CheY-like chemotaxis protein
MSQASLRASARILVVEDEPNAREGLCTLLEEEGFVVSEAEDGEDALRKLVELEPDVVLCDLEMPKLGGERLMRQAHERGSRARFIVMSGAGKIGATSAAQFGADKFLLKPLNLDEVLSSVQGLLAIGRR